MPKPQSEQPESHATPNPGLEKRTRRQFSTEYKLTTLAEANACQHGERKLWVAASLYGCARSGEST